jgi:hypothetical protein
MGGGTAPNRRIVFTYRSKPITNDEITVPKKANVQIAPKFRKKCLCSSIKFPYHILANQLNTTKLPNFPNHQHLGPNVPFRISLTTKFPGTNQKELQQRNF